MVHYLGMEMIHKHLKHLIHLKQPKQSQTPEKSETKSKETSIEKDKNIDKEKTGSIGEIVKVGDLEYTINKKVCCRPN